MSWVGGRLGGLPLENRGLQGFEARAHGPADVGPWEPHFRIQ